MRHFSKIFSFVSTLLHERGGDHFIHEVQIFKFKNVKYFKISILKVIYHILKSQIRVLESNFELVPGFTVPTLVSVLHNSFLM